MDPTTVGVVVFACTFGGALLGMWLRSRLPQRHLDSESRDTIKVGIGLVATLTALVLGLVTASAKSAFDTMDSAVANAAVDILTLDRVLARYGPETAEIRKDLQLALAARLDMIWPQGSTAPVKLDPSSSGSVSPAEGLAEAIRVLTPRDESQRALQSRALDLGEGLLQARWLVLGATKTSVPTPFLVILVSWLTFTFASFGLFAPRNVTVVAVLMVCAISVGSAMFLVLEMQGPFDGLIRVSADPLRDAYTHVNR